MEYRELVKNIVQSLVNKPEAVRIEEQKDNEQLLFLVYADREDVGKIIGKGGTVVQALRHLVSAAAAKDRQKAFVKVVTD